MPTMEHEALHKIVFMRALLQPIVVLALGVHTAQAFNLHSRQPFAQLDQVSTAKSSLKRFPTTASNVDPSNSAAASVLFAGTERNIMSSDVNGLVKHKNTLELLLSNSPLQRRHEQVLFAVYLLGSLALSRKLGPQQFESSIALVWLSFSLAISFMEAWVKFQSPLLRKHVAVDVGRHVFCAQHSVQLALACAFWICRRGVWRSSAGFLPSIMATGALLILAFGIGPLLYVRAKHKMVNEAKHQQELSAEERAALSIISNEISREGLPNARWHVAYVLVEMFQILSLVAFLLYS